MTWCRSAATSSARVLRADISQEWMHLMPHRGTTWGGRAAPARVAATTTALFGMVALAGWAFQLPALTRVMPGAVEMKANTAVALILCGLSLMMIAAPAAPRLERTGQVMALVAVAIGLASLAEYV